MNLRSTSDELFTPGEGFWLASDDSRMGMAGPRSMERERARLLTKRGVFKTAFHALMSSFLPNFGIFLND